MQTLMVTMLTGITSLEGNFIVLMKSLKISTNHSVAVTPLVRVHPEDRGWHAQAAVQATCHSTVYAGSRQTTAHRPNSGWACFHMVCDLSMVF